MACEECWILSARSCEYTSQSMQFRDAKADVGMSDASDRESMRRDAAVVRDHAAGVFRFVRSLGADPETAADITQDAFAKAWEKGKSGLQANALAIWLRRSARFFWLQHHQHERRREAAIACAIERKWREDQDDSGEQRVAAARTCMRLLKGRAAEVIRHVYCDGRGRADAAALMGMKPNGVKTLLARTRKWIEQCIERKTR